MDFEPKTIAEQIDCLAKLTGAPDRFVGQVRKLFSAKGISLDADATPYVQALEEAFTREESIRQNAREARDKAAALRGKFSELGETYARQVRRLREVQERLRIAERGLADRSNRVAIRGDHRTYVTDPQRDTLPMVPGPDDPQ